MFLSSLIEYPKLFLVNQSPKIRSVASNSNSKIRRLADKTLINFFIHKSYNLNFRKSFVILEERKGFEPLIPLTVYTLSKRAPSTTRPPLQLVYKFIKFFLVFKNILWKTIIKINFFKGLTPIKQISLFVHLFLNNINI